MSGDKMADCSQKLQATISAAVESCDKQDLIRLSSFSMFNFFLGPTDVQPVAICLLWCSVRFEPERTGTPFQSFSV